MGALDIILLRLPLWDFCIAMLADGLRKGLNM